MDMQLEPSWPREIWTWEEEEDGLYLEVAKQPSTSFEGKSVDGGLAGLSKVVSSKAYWQLARTVASR